MNFVISAPAKINLSLRVLGKREDGFHEIDTIMVKLPGLADQLEFRESADFSFTCDNHSLPPDEENLVVKAVRAFESATSIPCRHSISLKKLVPHGAGLGGGSSDAAATLSALNQLNGHPLTVADLHELAGSLGSDIPFFLVTGAFRCTGRGEIIQAIPSPPVLPVVLLKPQFAVPTPDAYGKWSGSRELPGISYRAQEYGGVSWVNDLERPVFEKHRFLAELKQWLLERQETAATLMSGSGSTVFAVLREGANAEALVAAARVELDPGLWHWIGLAGA